MRLARRPRIPTSCWWGLRASGRWSGFLTSVPFVGAAAKRDRSVCSAASSRSGTTARGAPCERRVGGGPPWLARPGRTDCGSRWHVVAEIYQALADQQPPPQAPPRDRRRVDVPLTYPDGQRQILEIDERQHFTGPRAQTLALYSEDVALGYDPVTWADAQSLAGREQGGRFARPCPPLFPGACGRHRQRTFRDALADLLPAEHGWLATLRVSEESPRAAGAVGSVRHSCWTRRT